MEPQVLEILKFLKSKKVHDKKAPTHITKKELSEAINKALDELELAGKIKSGRTINDTWIDPIEESKQ